VHVSMASNDAVIGDLARYLPQLDIPSEQVSATNWFRRVLSLEPDPPLDEVIQSGAVPKLVSFLGRDDDPKLQFEAAWALTNICAGNHHQVQFVVNQPGAVRSFVQLLYSSADDIREQASWALGNMAGDSTTVRDQVLAAGAAAAMAHLCASFAEQTRMSTIRNCMWTVSNMVRGKPLPPLETIRCLIPALAQQVNSTDLDSVSDACWALSYISDGSDDRCVVVVDKPLVLMYAATLCNSRLLRFS